MNSNESNQKNFFFFLNMNGTKIQIKFPIQFSVIVERILFVWMWHFTMKKKLHNVCC